jgi:hypothetical protein
MSLIKIHQPQVSQLNSRSKSKLFGLQQGQRDVLALRYPADQRLPILLELCQGVEELVVQGLLRVHSLARVQLQQLAQEIQKLLRGIRDQCLETNTSRWLEVVVLPR